MALYDEVAERARSETGGACVCVVVVGGVDGTGFGLSALQDVVGPLELAKVLRTIADEIDSASADHAKKTNGAQ